MQGAGKKLKPPTPPNYKAHVTMRTSSYRKRTSKTFLL